MTRSSLANPRTHGLAQMRGLQTDHELDPIASAVVIGLGGSGIQTISRIRSLILTDRPDRRAASQVQFLGVDSVPVEHQNPPLPEGVQLGAHEYLNIAEGNFEPARIIQHRSGQDPHLAAFWQANYTPEDGAVTLGMKRNRMLGHLASYVSRHEMVQRIGSSIHRAVAVAGNNPNVVADALPNVPIYIINSCSGGTGSSAFLEVLHAVWEAAEIYGFRPEIRSITYLPELFAEAVRRGPNGSAAVRSQKANAYGYFRELDHFMINSTSLSSVLGKQVPTRLSDNELLKQVFLVSGVLGNQGTLLAIPDAFDIVAEVVYQYLITDLGRPIVGADGTNYDALLTGTANGKPRRYCSLGVARAVFPRTTLEFNLYNRFIYSFIRDGLLHHPAGLETHVRNSDTLKEMVALARGLDEKVGKVEPDRTLRELNQLKSETMQAMEAQPDADQAANLIERIKTLATPARQSLGRLCGERARQARAELSAALVERPFAPGEGLPFAEEALRQTARALRAQRAANEARLLVQSRGETSSSDKVDQLLADLRKANGRRLHEELFAAIESIFGGSVSETQIAVNLGTAVQAWIDGIIGRATSEAVADALTDAIEQIEHMQIELDSARRELGLLAEDARVNWEQDELLGKDAGALTTSVYFPEDVQPQVDHSELLVEISHEVNDDYASRFVGEFQAEFLRRWRDGTSNRGLFSLGSERTAEQRRAEETLALALVKTAQQGALETSNGESRLPKSLIEAAGAETTSALVNRVLELSNHVMWRWDAARVHLGEDEDMPSVSRAVAAPASILDEVEFNAESVVDSHDEEQVVAVSTEWGVPVHALSQFEVWRREYERHCDNTRERPGEFPNPHIDDRFAELLDPAEPRFFDAGGAATATAAALIFSAYYRAQVDAGAGDLLDCFDSTRSEPHRALCESGPSGWRVNHLRQDAGRFRGGSSQTDLDSTWTELMTHFGRDNQARAMATHARLFLDGADVQVVAAVVSDYLEQQIKSEIKANPPKQELQALNVLADELAGWENELRLVINRSGID